MATIKTDILIIGGGMVGLSLANQILEKSISSKILILDKEEDIGKHSSGRNSGVIHSGLYYKPGSLKAKVCLDGANRLKSWINERSLPINNCGKVIIPQHYELDDQLEIIASRGRANGAHVEFIDESQLKQLSPFAKSSTGRALWSPMTSVVQPKIVLKALKDELIHRGVKFILGAKDWRLEHTRYELILRNADVISYGHIINCAGLQADLIAHKFGVGLNYCLLPFKGMYWQLKNTSPIKIKTNLYPVPDLSVPFLGVHFTPSACEKSIVSIGPTATPAWGRENYKGFKDIQLGMSLRNIDILLRQYLSDNGVFRRYVHEQAFLVIKPLLIRSAKELVPQIRSSDIELSEKVGIRSQLYNYSTKKLEDDFLCLPGPNSTHVLNAISPAFTGSFSLADLILEKSGLIQMNP